MALTTSDSVLSDVEERAGDRKAGLQRPEGLEIEQDHMC